MMLNVKKANFVMIACSGLVDPYYNKSKVAGNVTVVGSGALIILVCALDLLKVDAGRIFPVVCFDCHNLVPLLPVAAGVLSLTLSLMLQR